MKLKFRIAILGTRGIPNIYGGFEQFAEHFSVGLVEHGHEVYVYNPHDHLFQEKIWKGVHIIHCYDPEHKLGTFGQFVYDLNCILDSRKRNFDIILQLGYTSSSIWNWLFPKKSIIVTNMDGLEWKRSKYSKPVQLFLKFAEKLAVKHSNHLLADSLGIKKYLLQKYQVESTYIPYGATLFGKPDQNILKEYNLLPYQYDMLIARLEPENSIEIILDGFVKSGVNRKFIIIGNYKTKIGRYLTQKYHYDNKIVFLGAIYDLTILNNLRYFSNLYFHGHTVGGTNPSLLEAMASGTLIVANKNDFNAAILGGDAYYFINSDAVGTLIKTILKNESEQSKIVSNISKISSLYSWDKIILDYEQFLRSVLKHQ